MKNHYTLLCALLISTFAVLPATAQVFWSEDFADGLPPGWTNTDESLNNILWQYCPSPAACLPVGPLQATQTHSAANGFVMLNSDAAGNLPAAHRSRLRTENIDCSSRSQVFLQFQTAIATDDEPAAQAAVVRVYSGEGVFEYSPFPALTRTQQQYAPLPYLSGGPYYATFDISEAAAGQTNVIIEWEWEAELEFAWAVDDVQLSETHPARPEGAPFFETFAYGANGWTSSALPFSDPEAQWTWEPGGNVNASLAIKTNPTFEPYAYLPSVSTTDGAMVFNADFYTTMGTNPPDGPIEFYRCELISPVLDLSGADQPLAVELSHLAWLANTAPDAPQTPNGVRFLMSCSYSMDGGQNWSPPIPVNPFLTRVTSANSDRLPPFFGREYLPLPGAVGTEDFQVKFTWAGDLYFWAIDDVAIVERPAKDLRTNRNFFARIANAVTPMSQLLPFPPLADVENIGSSTASGGTQRFVVRRKSTQAEVYIDSLQIGELPVEALFENTTFEDWMPPAVLDQEGRYIGTYSVDFDSEDARPQDNERSFEFAVSDTLLAKEFGFTRDITPLSQFPSYAYGNCFYLPNGDGFYARYITFGISNPEQLAQEDRFVNVYLYRWEDDQNENMIADNEELVEVARNLYQFGPDDTQGLITLPISDEGIGVPLEDDTYYIAAVRYNYQDGPRMFMLVSDTMDYLGSNFAYNTAGLPAQYGGVLDINSSTDFFLAGFGFNIVPVVRLSISDSPVLNTRELLPEGSLSVYPQPADETATVELNGLQGMQQAELRLFSADGQLRQRHPLSPPYPHTLQLSLKGLPPGPYFLQIRTDQGTRTEQLLIQR